MAVAHIFTNKTVSKGEVESQTERERDKTGVGIQHLSVSVMLSTKLREKKR